MSASFPRKQPCAMCGAETYQKKTCPACGYTVMYVAPPPKPKRELESSVKAKIRAALCEAGVMVKIHNVDNRQMHTGLGPGTSDIICVVPPHGRFLAIEVKRGPREKATDDQLRFLAAVRQFGGVSGIATSVAEALALVAEARQRSPLHVDQPQP